MRESPNFDFDKEIKTVLPPTQDTLQELYARMRCVVDVEDGPDLWGEQLVVTGDELQVLQVRFHPFPDRDSERRMYRPMTLSRGDEVTHELWCTFDNQTLQLRCGAADATEHDAQQLLTYFAPASEEF